MGKEPSLSGLFLRTIFFFKAPRTPPHLSLGPELSHMPGSKPIAGKEMRHCDWLRLPRAPEEWSQGLCDESLASLKQGSLKKERGKGRQHCSLKDVQNGTSLAVQWLRLCASNAGDMGSIPGWGTKIPHAAQGSQSEKKKKVQENQRMWASGESNLKTSSSNSCHCTVVQSCSTLWPPWTAALQASLSFTVSWSLLKLMSIESMMPSNHLILCHPHFSSCSQSFPASGCFPVSGLFTSGGQSIGASASASVLPVNG